MPAQVNNKECVGQRTTTASFMLLLPVGLSLHSLQRTQVSSSLLSMPLPLRPCHAPPSSLLPRLASTSACVQP